MRNTGRITLLGCLPYRRRRRCACATFERHFRTWWPWMASIWKCVRANVSACLDPTARAKPPPSKSAKGLTDPDSGEVEVLGLRWEKDARRAAAAPRNSASRDAAFRKAHRTRDPCAVSQFLSARSVGGRGDRPGATGGKAQFPRGRPFRRPEATPGAGLRAGGRSRPAVPRRAHHRPRSRRRAASSGS